MKLLIESNELIDFQCLIEESVETKKKDYFISGPFLQSEIKNRNRRRYPSSVMENAVSQYKKEYIDSNRAVGELGHPACYVNNDFDVLTESGWKSFNDININDYVLAMNSNNEFVNSKVINKIEEKYTGDVYKFSGKNISSTVTSNHNFFLYDRNGNIVVRTAKEIYENPARSNKEKIIKALKYNKDANEFIIIPGVNVNNIKRFNTDVTKDLVINTSDFVKFLGFWLAEGHISKEKYRILISQNENNTLTQVRELMKRLPFNSTETEKINDKGNKHITISFSDIRLHTYLKENAGTSCYTKQIPTEIKKLSSNHLSDLVYWFALGDGRFLESGKIHNIFTTSKQLINDLQECVIKSGYSGKIIEIIPDISKEYLFAGHIIKNSNKNILYIMNISYTDGIYLDTRWIDIEKIENFDNYVYCLTTEHSNFYIRDKGKVYLTGNSPPINPERISHKIVSLVKEGSNYIGKAKILSTPFGLIAKNLMDDGIKLGVSSRGLGSLKEQGDSFIVDDDFQIITAADIVMDPSGPDCFVTNLMENKEWAWQNGKLIELESEIKEMINNTSKNKLLSNEPDKLISLFERILKLV